MQHAKEVKVKIGTVRLLELCVDGVDVVRAAPKKDGAPPPPLPLRHPDRAYVVYPGADAQPLEDVVGAAAEPSIAFPSFVGTTTCFHCIFGFFYAIFVTLLQICRQ